MAQTVLEVNDSFVDLERHRLRLEENVSKLRKSLQHWQTWEAEYEGMKEEIEGLGGQHTTTKLVHTAKESAGTLLNEKEVNLLLFDDKGRHRDSSQIIGLLSRRIDYVQQNVKTVTALLGAAEEKLVASTVISRPGVLNEEGLPLIEIQEELDEGGNVVSSSTIAPGDAAPQMVEALRKAGVNGLPNTPQPFSKPNIDSANQGNESLGIEDQSDPPALSIMKSPHVQELGQSNSMSRDSSNEQKPSSRRKSVTFAAGTKVSDATSSKQRQLNSRSGLNTINEIKRQAGLTNIPAGSVKPKKPSKRSLEKYAEFERVDSIGQSISDQLIQNRVNDARHGSTEKHNEEIAISSSKNKSSTEITPSHLTNGPTFIEARNPHVDLESPIIPADDSPEDAALRRQMLEYNINEVGAVVAEIELDEDDESLSDASYTDDEGEDSSDAGSRVEDEDEYGRTTRLVLGDVYFEEMRALEKKLNASAIQNVGPHANGIPSPVIEKVINSASGDDSSEGPSSHPSRSSISKGVRFAEELDIQEATPKDQRHGIAKPVSRTIEDTIVERITPVDGSTEPAAAPKKVSRFKRAIAGDHTTSSPKVASNVPVADNIVERKPSKISASSKSISTRYHLRDETAFTALDSTREVPTGPPNRTHAPTVIERPYSATAETPTAVEPDGLDPTLLHQQVASEYHRMRNRMIQRQGGFLATDEEKAETPLTEEEGGAPKISRFKAARLARIG